MPPRKSNVSTASAVSNEESTAPKPAPAPAPVPVSRDDSLGVEVYASKPQMQCETNNPQDLNLPKSIVQRLAKGVLPPNTQIQKDALLAMSKSATVFVNYITSAYGQDDPAYHDPVC
jgi:DNA polymerase epsilon subunit 3